MMNLCCDVIKALNGRTLATAESCTGGGIGEAITAVPGSSAVFKGGIISYTNEIKKGLLGVTDDTLLKVGAVSSQVAEQMAIGARAALKSDIAISVTGLAGPGGDEFGNPLGTVYVGYADADIVISKKLLFSGDRAQVRTAAKEAALKLLLSELDK